MLLFIDQAMSGQYGMPWIYDAIDCQYEKVGISEMVFIRECVTFDVTTYVMAVFP